MLSIALPIGILKLLLHVSELSDWSALNVINSEVFHFLASMTSSSRLVLQQILEDLQTGCYWSARSGQIRYT